MVVSSWKLMLAGVGVMVGVADAFSPAGLATHSRLGLRGASGAAIGRRMGVQAAGLVMDLDWYKVGLSARPCSCDDHPRPYQPEQDIVNREDNLSQRTSSGPRAIVVVLHALQATHADGRLLSSPMQPLHAWLTTSGPTVQAEKGDELPGGGNKYTFTVDVSVDWRPPHAAEALCSAISVCLNVHTVWITNHLAGSLGRAYTPTLPGTPVTA